MWRPGWPAPFRAGTARLICLSSRPKAAATACTTPKPPKARALPSGETVTLYYDPEDPEKMYVEGDRSVLGAEILYFCLAVVLLALMVSFSR